MEPRGYGVGVYRYWKEPLPEPALVLRSRVYAELKGLASEHPATRYHSLVADPSKIPECLEVTALSMDDHEIMAVRHKKYLIEGVQFHPESVMTTQGPQILVNFLNMIRR
jgi:anthranilate/para-aminobenzoate synthase component II